jgi:hypothetical protein
MTVMKHGDIDIDGHTAGIAECHSSRDPLLDIYPADTAASISTVCMQWIAMQM